VPVGVIVGFLAVVASWMTYDNEHMIRTLARYQREILSKKHFETALPEVKLWESSEQLETVRQSGHRYVHSLIQESLVVVPAIFATLLQWFWFHQPWWWNLGASIFTVIAIGISVKMAIGWHQDIETTS
jgi:hypothetical protein